MTRISPNVPYQASRSALMRASLAAFAGAAVILVIFVLPAEYGIDPTGAGKALGLTAMANTEGAEDSDDAPDSSGNAEAERSAIPLQAKATIEQKTALRSDEKTLTLAPHSGVEMKAHMVQGDHLIFRWTSTGPVRMDMHGEPKAGRPDEFTTYWKQKNLTEAQGSFTAPFAGAHGWFWRNGGETPVTLTIRTSGFYAGLFEVPAE